MSRTAHPKTIRKADKLLRGARRRAHRAADLMHRVSDGAAAGELDRALARLGRTCEQLTAELVRLRGLTGSGPKPDLLLTGTPVELPADPPFELGGPSLDHGARSLTPRSAARRQSVADEVRQATMAASGPLG